MLLKKCQTLTDGLEFAVNLDSKGTVQKIFKIIS